MYTINAEERTPLAWRYRYPRTHANAPLYYKQTNYTDCWFGISTDSKANLLSRCNDIEQQQIGLMLANRHTHCIFDLLFLSIKNKFQYKTNKKKQSFFFFLQISQPNQHAVVHFSVLNVSKRISVLLKKESNENHTLTSNKTRARTLSRKSSAIASTNSNVSSSSFDVWQKKFVLLKVISNANYLLVDLQQKSISMMMISFQQLIQQLMAMQLQNNNKDSEWRTPKHQFIKYHQTNCSMESTTLATTKNKTSILRKPQTIPLFIRVLRRMLHRRWMNRAPFQVSRNLATRNVFLIDCDEFRC